MMLARHSKPMEMSSPALVFRPLWQATQRSEVRKTCGCNGRLRGLGFRARGLEKSRRPR